LDRISIEEQRTKKIINSLEDSLVTCNKKGIIITSNSAFFKKFYFNDTDVVGNKVLITQILPGFDIKKVFEDLKRTDNVSEMVEMESQTKTGVKMRSKVSVSLSEIFTNSIKTPRLGDENEMTEIAQDANKKERVCVILIHNLTEQKASVSISTYEKQLNTLMDEFMELFTDLEKRQHLLEFCQQERNDENLLFLIDVQFYRSLGNIQERVNMQQEIFNKYIKANSPKQLNISKKQLETHSFKISRGLGEFELFDDLEKVVVQNIVHDSYKRFKDINK